MAFGFGRSNTQDPTCDYFQDVSKLSSFLIRIHPFIYLIIYCLRSAIDQTQYIDVDPNI